MKKSQESHVHKLQLISCLIYSQQVNNTYKYHISYNNLTKCQPSYLKTSTLLHYNLLYSNYVGFARNTQHKQNDTNQLRVLLRLIDANKIPCAFRCVDQTKQKILAFFILRKRNATQNANLRSF